MARGLTSLILVVTACGGLAQGLGRFGLSGPPEIPGFVVDEAGFRTRFPGSDTLRFIRPIKLQRSKTSADESFYRCGTFAGTPQALRINLWAQGFDLYWPFGLQLKVKSLTAPLLTVHGATYGPGTPTSAESWMLVTFSDRQPPLLLCFLDPPKEVVVEGSSGDWTLRTLGLYKGWVRVCLPFGLDPKSANGVGELGVMAKQIEKLNQWLSQTPPRLRKTVFWADDDSVSVRWIFDKSGATVPPAAVLCKSAGYKVKIPSKIEDLQTFTDEGPIVRCIESVLEVKFPLKRVPVGRSLVLGTPEVRSTQSLPSDVPHIVQASLSNLVSCFPLQNNEVIFQSGALEGRTKSDDLVAAIHILAQSLANCGVTVPSDRSRRKIIWSKFDPLTLGLCIDDPTVSRRANAINSVAEAIDSDPEFRARAAMLQAHLSYEEFLPEFTKKRGLPEAPTPAIHPLRSLRNYLFGLGKVDGKIDTFSKSLFSEVRVLSNDTLVLERTNGKNLLSWSVGQKLSGTVSIASITPIQFKSSQNVPMLRVEEVFGASIVNFTAMKPGRCTVTMTRPSWATPLPTVVNVPEYSESP